MTDTANKTLDTVQVIFKKVVWDTLVTVGLTYLYAQVPVLAVWPLNQIISFLIRIFSDKLFDVLKLVVDLETIVFLNEAHKAAYESASLKLKVIAHDKGVDSKEFLDAREEAKKDLSKFTRFGSQWS